MLFYINKYTDVSMYIYCIYLQHTFNKKQYECDTTACIHSIPIHTYTNLLTLSAVHYIL